MSAANETPTHPEQAQPAEGVRHRSGGADGTAASEPARTPADGAAAAEVRGDAVAGTEAGAASEALGGTGAGARTAGARTNRVEARMSDDELAHLDRVAAEVGKTRSDVLRAVSPEVAEMLQRAMDRAARRKVQDAELLRQAIEAMDALRAEYNGLHTQERRNGYLYMQLVRHSHVGGTVDADALKAVARLQGQVLDQLERRAETIDFFEGLLSWAR